MGRIHAPEFEDYSWFPSGLRNFMTDFLEHVAHKFDFYKDLTPFLVKGVKASGTNTIIDLASGGGGDYVKIGERVASEIPDIKIKFSDYYPNIEGFKRAVKKGGDKFSYIESPVNAMDVPADHKGLRTMFLSFHHFRPNDAKQILQNAVDSKQPIFIAEAQERNIMHFIAFFFSPINVLIMTPFIRPFNIWRLVFTYLIPLVPLFVWWDGLASVLRTYSEKEMNELIKSLNNGDSFEWEVGKKKAGPSSIPYLLGIPKS